ncbi:cytochrome P450 [Mycobacterium sp. CBMA293]|uniref:cytochrome P450 n=1 Tax=unclassified Mycolicibacterium TaxID=2636767 RepID=UPI0012DF8353|nr:MULTISPECIES: cytochrome P450 [unclassified Mycolicibacterium]MUL49872.1 cytochrome P450 [Mycolicibacterium sp. CBMA 360]MUL61494.1 cytochrome P450 [Mycolicibacterium sp. CBMA 335]MUL74229.1 cytochrome P450 [Mycolicibacterium sp. CBMA 311]MUL97145.1 cytochrome P450 [Mycolicibacterium sp. CBMA 230]MUM08207.1 cytochrome [Mycolicibacterium sp. CBMA 213]
MTVELPTASVFDIAWPAITYHDAHDPDEAHRLIRQARQRAPIAMGPYGPEVLSYELVHTVLRDSRFAMPRGIGLAVQGINSGPVWDKVTKLIANLDGAEHQRLRRLVARAFTPRAAARMRTACVNVITELIDAYTAVGHCDVVTDIARPYPVSIICALLGAPREDWHLFTRWADDIGEAFGANVANEERAIVTAWAQLDAYVEDMIARRRRCRTDDLISELIRAEDDGEQLNHDELVDLVALLLYAGTDTTRNQLAAAIQILSTHPDQWALLGEHAELAPRAVEELMRYFPIAFSAIRVATQDVELGGVLIPAGTFVLANTAAANRDPSMYDKPDRLDITRNGAAPMLTFGGGVHYCLGSHLARLELTEALCVITKRLANPRRTGPAPWKAMTGISGPTTLPIAFEVGQ